MDVFLKLKVDKRAAILLDKIMYAVQKALDEDTKKGRISNGHPNLASFTGVSTTISSTLEKMTSYIINYLFNFWRRSKLIF